METTTLRKEKLAAAPSPLLSRYVGQAVLAIGAHPDDVELGAGGTIARLSEEGARVTIVICAPSGAKPRLEEARRAADVLGAKFELLSGRRAVDLESYELVERLDELVRAQEPALLLTHAETNYHRDDDRVHRACAAVQRARPFDMLCFCPTSAHLVATPFRPSVFVDISGVITRKMAAVEVHKEALARKGLTLDHYRRAADEYGRRVGVTFAEGFEASRLRLA
jgi:LmbE family N-acetylglucosaminyl deacetylase